MTTDKNGKIKLTLTPEQILDVKECYDNWIWSDYYRIDHYGTYLQSNPLTLEVDVPNLWRTDIENAPRDGTVILISAPFASYIEYDAVRWVHERREWSGLVRWYGETEIKRWMEIPKVPES